MVSGYGNIHTVVAKLQGKFTTSKKLLVSPAFVVGVSGQARESLRNKKDIVATFTRIIGEVLIT